jgi:non-heme chloroperoxidase
VAEITEREQRQIDHANSSGKTPVVFIHGLWLLPSSWDNWVGLFEENGYAGVTPSWPDDPEAVEEARANPEVFARKTLKQVADHTAKVIRQLDKRPAVMGHSTGGLLTYMIADRGLSAASVAIDPGPFRGVLPLPLSALKSASPVLRNRSTEAARSPSPSTSSSTDGRTRSTSRRRGTCTTPTTWPAPGWP